MGGSGIQLIQCHPLVQVQMQKTTGDAWRDAIAACHKWSESEGVVTQDGATTYVKIREPYKGLLLEELIRSHGFKLSAHTRASDCIVLFNR